MRKPKIKKEIKPERKKYLTNKELLKEIENCKTQDRMTEEFGKMVMMLAHRYAQKGNFVNYSYNEDMQAFAIMTVAKVWRSFNPQKSLNVFSFLTTVVKHAFFQYLNMERKNRDLRDALLIEHGDSPSYTFHDDDGNGSDDGGYEYYNYRPAVSNTFAEEEY